jgi:soluble lytic murein transglycosylase-like protein
MRILPVLLLLAGVCLHAAEMKVEPLPKVLVLKSGQRLIYDELSREGSTLFVRMGSQSIMIDAADVAAAPPPTPAPAPQSDVQVLNVPGPAARLIGENAGKHNLRPELIQAVMEIESGYQVNARSRSGAIGLMQLMPQTAKHLKVNAYDPEQNVEGGARLLDMLVKKYENHRNGLALALAAYNAGPGAVDRFGGIPPYQETRQYVVKVIRRFRELVRE